MSYEKDANIKTNTQRGNTFLLFEHDKNILSIVHYLIDNDFSKEIRIFPTIIT